MTYDDWKAREPEPQYDPPQRCDDCGHREDYCDCPCCGPVRESPDGE